MLSRVPIDKSLTPYTFEITLGAEIFRFTVRYNAEFDFFTVDAYKNGVPLVYGEKLTYGVPLFKDVRDQRYPVLELVPLDESGKEQHVSYDNLGKTVYLVVNP